MRCNAEILSYYYDGTGCLKELTARIEFVLDEWAKLKKPEGRPNRHVRGSRRSDL